MAPLRVAIVGCGRIADLHVLGYRDRADAHIAAVCDTNRELAGSARPVVGRQEGLHRLQALLADRDIDLVELLVPHHLHADMTVAACDAGKHVSVQKPMALSVTEADRMIGGGPGAGRAARLRELRLLSPARPACAR